MRGTPTRSSRCASANDVNLNIHRYADNAPPPEPHDVRAHVVGGIPKRNRIEAVRNEEVGLVGNLDGTGIPACILVLRAKGAKPPERRGKVLFINADAEFSEGRAQNYLLPEASNAWVSSRSLAHRTRALRWLPRRIEPWAQRMGVRPAAIDVRDLGYRWGSLGRSDRVNFHWATMQLPPSLVDYVIVHELAHVHEPHHTPEFWLRVERALPAFQTAKSDLARVGARLWLGDAIPVRAQPSNSGLVGGAP